MAEPHLILFDCDGTIVDSEALIVDAMVRAFDMAGMVAPSSAEVRRVIGLSLPIAVKQICVNMNENAAHTNEIPHPKITNSAIEKIAEGYKTSYGYLRDELGHDEPLFEGITELIHKLAATDHYILGIATGKSMKGVDNLLKRYDMTNLFHTIQTADNAPSKPHPGMIHQALSETGITSKRAVMIGDTTFDMEMAKNGGIDAIGVTWGHHEMAELLPFNPRFIIDTMTELEQAISETFSKNTMI